MDLAEQHGRHVARRAGNRRISKHPNIWPFDLKLHSLDSGHRMQVVFASSYEDMTPERREETDPDPLAKYSSLAHRGSFDLPGTPERFDPSHALVFDSFALGFALHKRWEETGNGFHSHVLVEVQGEQLYGITTYDTEPNGAVQ